MRLGPLLIKKKKNRNPDRGSNLPKVTPQIGDGGGLEPGTIPSLCSYLPHAHQRSPSCDLFQVHSPVLLEAQSPLWVRASVPRVENSDHNRSSPETSRAQISGKGLIGPARSHVHSLTNQLCPGLHVYLVAKLCLTLCNRMGPGSSVHGILQARILEWVAMLSSRESPLRDLRSVSCTGRWILYH